VYTELHIQYIDPGNQVKPLIVKYKLNDLAIVQRWAGRLKEALDSNYQIDRPDRFYGFDDVGVERLRAVADINHCCDVIESYSPGLINRRVNKDYIEQDTLNYLHDIFETYHGSLDRPHEFFISAPKLVQQALSDLNLEVHRCEGLANDNIRKMLPRHMVTYYALNKADFTLELDDYKHFTDFFEFGTMYLLYTEVGKTLQDLAVDDDHHVDQDAYKPFRHFSADFEIKFYTMSGETRATRHQLYKKHYLANKEYYLGKGYDYAHPYNRPGSIPLGKLIGAVNIEDIRLRPCVGSLTLIL